MADSIQFPRGNKATMPVLPDGAPGWCKDEKALYIGHPEGNQKVGDAAMFQKMTNLETAQKTLSETVASHTTELKTQGEALGRKLEANAVEAQAALGETADLAAVIGAVNSLIAAMKTSKVMNE